ncbi:MAG: sensor histidine kinase [bacterium]
MGYDAGRYKSIFLYIFILTLILIVYNGILYFSIRVFLMNDIDDNLEINAAEIAEILTPDRIKGLHNGSYVFERKRDYIRILDAHGKLIFKSHNITDDLSSLLDRTFTPPSQEITFSTGNIRTSFFRAVHYPLIENEETVCIVQIVMPVTTLLMFLTKLRYIIWITMAGVVVLMVLLMALFAKNLFKPILLLENYVDHISQKDLTQRIPDIKSGQEVRNVIRSFNAMMERLDKSFTNMSDFASYIAHELKTPLAIMRGEMELALMQKKFTNAQQTIIASFLEEIERMNRIIRDLHYLAKIDYLPDLLSFERINFNEYLAKIYTDSAVLAAERDIEIVLDSHEEEFMIMADKTHLRRLFLNIITNAIKYTEPKGKISIATKRDKLKVYIDIADTGIGITQEDLAKVFDKSFQVDKSRKTGDTGSGLGLTIALAIARAHQGDITVKSELKQGSTFTVILPLV